MSSIARPQDLPPPGGYAKVPFEKVPHKTFINGKWIFVTFAVSYTLGFWGYYESMKIVRGEKLERKSANNAVQPFLLAERDRQLLKQMRKNREFEGHLMKDVKGWTVGTLFGTPVYNTLGENDWAGYNGYSYYAHGNPEDRREAYNFPLVT